MRNDLNVFLLFPHKLIINLNEFPPQHPQLQLRQARPSWGETTIEKDKNRAITDENLWVANLSGTGNDLWGAQRKLCQYLLQHVVLTCHRVETLTFAVQQYDLIEKPVSDTKSGSSIYN